jgi:prolyl-tRNA synthetase
MGSYGIGVTRSLALLAENNHDELGLRWPAHVAPYHVHVVATGKDDAAFVEAERLAGELDAAGIEVLYDDRPKVSPGVKFKDAELLGAPSILVVGRGLEQGEVELKTRETGETRALPVADAVAEVSATVAAALA